MRAFSLRAQLPCQRPPIYSPTPRSDSTQAQVKTIIMDNTFTLRPPTLEDGPLLHQLIASCPPLDVNTAYAYHLIGAHFAATSVVAQDKGGNLVGAITGYLPPQKPTTLFIWQVAVHEAARGCGLALRMLNDIFDRHQGLSMMHTTIGPGNTASHRLFARFADNRGAQLKRDAFIPADACGPGHEAEELIIIGPIAS